MADEHLSFYLRTKRDVRRWNQGAYTGPAYTDDGRRRINRGGRLATLDWYNVYSGWSPPSEKDLAAALADGEPGIRMDAWPSATPRR